MRSQKSATRKSGFPLFSIEEAAARVISAAAQMKETLRKSLGLVIKKRRERLALSQDQLAVRSDLHRTYVSDIERGARNLSFDSIYSVSKGLGVLPSLLFAEAELNAYKSAGEKLPGDRSATGETAHLAQAE